MKVYIDLVVIMNFLFDFILLSSVNYILKRNSKIWRIVVSSLMGEVTMIVLFFKMSNTVLLIFKLLISITMILVCFGCKDIRYILKNTLYFYLVSILMGGGIEFLNNQLGDGYYKLNGCYFAIVIIGIFLFIKFIFNINGLKVHYSNYYPCKIYFSENNYIEVTAFLDTGNKLIDPITKKDIVLIDSGLYDFSKLKPLYVPFNTLNSHGLLECYKALKLEIEGRCYKKFLVGVSQDRLCIDGINCILSTKIWEGLQ